MKKDSEMIQIISTGVEKNKSRLQYLKKENEIIRMYFTASFAARFDEWLRTSTREQRLSECTYVIFFQK